MTHGTEREAMSFCFVRVETDDGTVGWGEACDSYGCSYASVLATIVTDVFAPLVVGAAVDAGAPSAITERLTLATRRRLGTGWAAAQARSAIELALWDLVGQARRHVGVVAASVGIATASRCTPRSGSSRRARRSSTSTAWRRCSSAACAA